MLIKREEIAAGHEEGAEGGKAETEEFDPEVAKGKCISCHGGDLEGSVGPALAGTSLLKKKLLKLS